MNESTGLLERLAAVALERLEQRRSIPTATYRLQFGAGFTFRDATEHIPYLHRLGISHVYASPIFRARPGSTSGYDVCDHNELNPELGGEAGFREFTTELHKQGMGLIVDFVPNHMSASVDNRWWADVLENGPSSPYSGFFDIDWTPVKPDLAGQVLLPILGAQYGEVLENGQLQIVFRDGAFLLSCYDHLLPLGPRTTVPVLVHRLDELRVHLGEDSEAFIELQSILTALEHLPPQSATTTEQIVERQREKEVIKRRLRDLCTASSQIAEHIAQSVLEFNGQAGVAQSFDRLDAILAVQPYRVCHWRAAADEVNYRRFFDVNELAAVCMEKPEVFFATHRLAARLLAAGEIDGLRIDHIDGLLSPENYLWRLQWSYLAELVRSVLDDVALSDGMPTVDPAGIGLEVLRELCRRLRLPLPGPDDVRAVFGVAPPDVDAVAPATPAEPHTGHAREPLFVVVEKILGPEEPLPESWPVAGTTGYDSLNTLNGLFIAATGWDRLRTFYRRFTLQTIPFPEIVHASKRLILRVAMSSELQMLAHQLDRISEQHRRSRDFTLIMLRFALREILSEFPVYRTYPGPAGVSDRDRRFVQQAVRAAKRRNPATDPSLFDFIRDVLLLAHPPGSSEETIRQQELFCGRFQQVTSPVMAKGVEDTAFYIDFPLLSVNEVGGDPHAAVSTVETFHRENRERQKRGLHGLITTSTHDTKRSEDVRARINLLSEIPELWSAAVRRWSRRNRRFRTEVDGMPVPTSNDEYLLYQTLLGIWPLQEPSSQEQTELVARLQRYMEKAVREAKQHTSWISPHQAYEDGVRNFVAEILKPDKTNRFLDDFQLFAARVIDAGQYASLSQLVLKVMSPGIPDIYQGQEEWNYSLVDPDNRRPVNFSALSERLDSLSLGDPLSTAELQMARQLGAAPRDPRLKTYVTCRLLRLRQRLAELFSRGEYHSCSLVGPRSDHLIAFGWHARGSGETLQVLTVVPRLLASLMGLPSQDSQQPSPMSPALWEGTRLVLPEGTRGEFVHVLTGRSIAPIEDSLRVENILEDFPVAVLTRTVN